MGILKLVCNQVPSLDPTQEVFLGLTEISLAAVSPVRGCFAGLLWMPPSHGYPQGPAWRAAVPVKTFRSESSKCVCKESKD